MTKIATLFGASLCAFATLVLRPDMASADALVDFVADKAAVIELTQNKAKLAVITAAHDSYIQNFLEAQGEYVRRRLKPSIDAQLVGIQAGLTVDEICLISHDGREFARIVRGEVADDPSDDESDAIFFEPTWKMGEYEVYVSPIYRSPDTDEWVFSFSAPIGEKKNAAALLHLEQNLGKVLGYVALRPAPADMRWYVVADHGLVVFDSAEGIGSAKPPTASHDPAEAFPRVSILGPGFAELLNEARTTASIVFDETPKAGRVAVANIGRWAVVAVENGR